MKVEVAILPKFSVPPDRLIYVVMAARFEGNWLFVRHRDRITWEMPAGHIETGETPDEAAGRELFEETGADEFEILYLLDYSVRVKAKLEYGRLYLAEIISRKDEVEYEMEEVSLEDELPSLLTYPEVQKILFREASAYFELGRFTG